jgi:hypothetical protein
LEETWRAFSMKKTVQTQGDKKRSGRERRERIRQEEGEEKRRTLA